MIEKVTIKDNTNTPLPYLPKVFANGTEFTFRSGVNVIVGANGCGKSTLLRLIECYLLIDKDEQMLKGIHNLFDIGGKRFLDGADVKSDYMLKTFRFCHLDEMRMDGDRLLRNLDNFGMLINGSTASTGEAVTIAVETLFRRVFGTDVSSPIISLKGKARTEREDMYYDYVRRNAIPYDDDYAVTILMDEPDRNLDLFNMREIYEILANGKEHMQLIAVIHNPLLIHRLCKVEGIRFIELTDGYMEKISNEIKKYL